MVPVVQGVVGRSSGVCRARSPPGGVPFRRGLPRIR